MIEIYTDGSCSHNGTWDGGWAFVVVQNGVEVYSEGGHEKATTNNRMEMTAIIKAIEYARDAEINDMTIYTDSAYVHNAITKGWLENWTRNGWINSKKQPVANKDLWEIFNNGCVPKLVKVEGHSDNEFNNRADRLAVQWRDNR